VDQIRARRGASLRGWELNGGAVSCIAGRGTARLSGALRGGGRERAWRALHDGSGNCMTGRDTEPLGGALRGGATQGTLGGLGGAEHGRQRSSQWTGQGTTNGEGHDGRAGQARADGSGQGTSDGAGHGGGDRAGHGGQDRARRTGRGKADGVGHSGRAGLGTADGVGHGGRGWARRKCLGTADVPGHGRPSTEGGTRHGRQRIAGHSGRDGTGRGKAGHGRRGRAEHGGRVRAGRQLCPSRPPSPALPEYTALPCPPCPARRALLRPPAHPPCPTLPLADMPCPPAVTCPGRPPCSVRPKGRASGAWEGTAGCLEWAGHGGQGRSRQNGRGWA
jgi:hypothetical protein